MIELRESRNLKKRVKDIDKADERTSALVREQGFWFVDVPRTSSTSIRVQLGAQFGAINGKANILAEDRQYATKGQKFRDHTTALKMRRALGAELWDSLYTFAFVRDPYARIYSLYHYLLKVGNKPKSLSLRVFLQKIKDGEFSRIEYASASAYMMDPDGRVIVSKVCKFESRALDLLEVGNTIGARLSGVWIQKASIGDYRPAFDAESRQIVRELYPLDFEIGSYQP